jgi:hypothetical protein
MFAVGLSNSNQSQRDENHGVEHHGPFDCADSTCPYTYMYAQGAHGPNIGISTHYLDPNPYPTSVSSHLDNDLVSHSSLSPVMVKWC